MLDTALSETLGHACPAVRAFKCCTPKFPLRCDRGPIRKHPVFEILFWSFFVCSGVSCGDTLLSSYGNWSGSFGFWQWIQVQNRFRIKRWESLCMVIGPGRSMLSAVGVVELDDDHQVVGHVSQDLSWNFKVNIHQFVKLDLLQNDSPIK